MAYLRVSSPGTEQLGKGAHVLEEQKRVAEMMQTMITPQLTLLMTYDINGAQFETQLVEDRKGQISSCTLW